jgi:hypothetical protein
MMYIEIIEPTPTSRGEVRTYLDHSPHTAEHFSFDEVLAGNLDAEMRTQIGPAAADELKAAVREVMAAPTLTPEEHKRQDILRRRAEPNPPKPAPGSAP